MPSPRGLRDQFGTGRHQLIRELGAFGVVGGLAFLVQVGGFQLLYAHLGIGAVTSNLVATVVSMTVAYVGHRYWSFSHRERSSVGREYLIFTLVNGVTLALGLAVVALVRYPLGQDGALVLQTANVGSIVLGTVIRYQAYRRWVFTAPTGGPLAGAPAAPADVDGPDVPGTRALEQGATAATGPADPVRRSAAEFRAHRPGEPQVQPLRG